MEIKRPIDKQNLRKKILAARDGLDESERIYKSRQITRQLTEMQSFLEAEIILTYIDYRSEVLTAPMVEAVLKTREKGVFCPKVMGETMDFYEITDISQLVKGYRGIREPDQTADKRFTTEHYQGYRCMVIMPGTVFDRERGRIGYGKGFYDRFLAAYPDLPVIALAYDCQIAPAVPMEPHDRRPDMIITEHEIII